MSFSQQVKKEIVSHELPKRCCATAAAYGVACFGKYFDVRGIVLHTEQLAVAEYAQKILERAGIRGQAYPRNKEKASLFEFSVKDQAQVRKMLALLGHTGQETTLRINSRNFVCDHCVNAFVSMAFLCCGTMTNPEKEYNLEFLSGRYNLMHDFEALLLGRGFSPRHTQRKGSNVLYLKSSEQIEDLLTFMGATNAALAIMHLKVYKDIRNKANRITNCETANIDKIVSANQNALVAIAYLKKHGAISALPTALQVAARLREEHPDASLLDLAAQFDPPLSKSGLSHRMKKLEHLAKEMKERATYGG